jgi:plasmid maintenance system killer protein
MKLVFLRKDLREYLREHQLTIKWKKSSRLFEENIRHPSLNTELLEPHWRGIYSFRIDRKYRAHFFITPKGDAEVFLITNHYKK